MESIKTNALKKCHECVTVELSWSRVAIRSWNNHDGCHHAFEDKIGIQC